MSGSPARTPGSRMARSGEEETESTRSFSRPANTPLRECGHLGRYFSTPTYPTQLIGTLFISCSKPPTWSAWSGSSAPRSGVPGWAGLAAGERELDVITVNFFWLLKMLVVWQIMFVLYLMTADSQFDYWLGWCWLIWTWGSNNVSWTNNINCTQGRLICWWGRCWLISTWGSGRCSQFSERSILLTDLDILT